MLRQEFLSTLDGLLSLLSLLLLHLYDPRSTQYIIYEKKNKNK